MKALALVPIFDHASTIEAVVDGLAPLALPGLIVDDGSGPKTEHALQRVVRHPRNCGRGAALVTGYREAQRPGATLAVLDRSPCRQRMAFDPEIAVRLVWAGVSVVNVATPVRYYPGGISHFDMLADNVRISWMHTRLLAGMLLRLPQLLARRLA